MTERLVVNPAVLEGLFPDEEKRKLVSAFIGEASKIIGISRIISYDLNGRQRIGIISFGDTSSDDLDGQVNRMYGKFSNHRYFSEVLGFPNVVSELQFKDMILCDPETSADETIDLWDREKTIVQVAA